MHALIKKVSSQGLKYIFAGLVASSQGCIKHSSVPSESQALANTSEDEKLLAQNNLQKELKQQLARWFPFGRLADQITSLVPEADLRDLEIVTKYILMKAVQETIKIQETEPFKSRGITLTPSMIYTEFTQLFCPSCEAPYNKKPAVPQSFIMTPAMITPFFTRILTTQIRKQKQANQPINHSLGAVALVPGPKRNLTFKSIINENPQMALSTKANDVFIVTEFHRLTLNSIYLKSQSDVNDLLAIPNFQDVFPRLERIVANTILFENILINLRDGHLTNLLPKHLTWAVDDPYTSEVATKVLSLFKRFPKQTAHIDSLGFITIGQGGLSSEASKELLRFLKKNNHFRSLELHSELISDLDKPLLQELDPYIILNPVALLKLYDQALPKIKTLQMGRPLTRCQDIFKQFKEEADNVAALGQKLRNFGLEVGITPRGHSAMFDSSY